MIIKLLSKFELDYKLKPMKTITFFQKNVFALIYRFKDYIELHYFNIESNYHKTFRIHENESNCFYTESFCINEDYFIMYYGFNIYIFKINDKRFNFQYEINLYDDFIIDFEGNDSPYYSPKISFLNNDSILFCLNRESENCTLIIYNFITKNFEYIFNYKWRYKSHLLLENDELFLVYSSEWKHESNKIIVLDLNSKSYKELKTFIGNGYDYITDFSISSNLQTLLYCENYDSMLPRIVKLDLTTNITKDIFFTYNLFIERIFFSSYQNKIITIEFNIVDEQKKLKIWDLELNLLEEDILGIGKLLFNNDSNKCILLNENYFSVFEIYI